MLGDNPPGGVNVSGTVQDFTYRNVTTAHKQINKLVSCANSTGLTSKTQLSEEKQKAFLNE